MGGEQAKPFTIVSGREHWSNQKSPGGIIQWAIRFCQTPESLPVFLSWVRSIWPECPFTDQEIAQDLVGAHELVTSILQLVEVAQ